MRLQSENGKSKVSGLLWLFVFILVAYATWNVAPVYFANWTFKDTMRDLARKHPSIRPDANLQNDLRKEAADRGLADYLFPPGCMIRSTDVERLIVCEYEREVQVLPGVKHKFHFRNEVKEKYY